MSCSSVLLPEPDGPVERDKLARLEVDDVAQRVDPTVVALRDAIDGDRSSAQRLT